MKLNRARASGMEAVNDEALDAILVDQINDVLWGGKGSCGQSAETNGTQFL